MKATFFNLVRSAWFPTHPAHVHAACTTPPPYILPFSVRVATPPSVCVCG
jgi:hypothetical protein